MSKRSILTVVLAALSCHWSGHAQQLTSTSDVSKPRDLTPATGHRTMAERGLKGSPTRPAAAVFNGTPLFPALALVQAQRGGPSDSVNTSGGASSSATLAIKSSRFAALEDTTTAGANKSLAATAGKELSANPNLTFDPRAQMISPVDGSVLYPTQNFTWTTGSGVGEYYLWIGSCFECNDLLNENEGLNLSRTVDLPVDGRLIYVTLFSWINNGWYWIDYQYQASQGGNPFPAQMTSPAIGSTLTSPQAFTWNAGYAVDDFYLAIGSCQGCADILNENEGQNLWRTVNLPTDGRTVFARLFSSIAGTWFYYDYQYRAPLVQSSQNVRVNIVNQLAEAVNVVINGTLVGSCPALTTAGIDVNVSALSVAFQVIQPSLNGRPLGDVMSGIFNTITNPSGTINFIVSNQIGSNFYFQPLITNQTPLALDIEVNGGLQAENRCNCSAPAGDVNVNTGYYLFYSNSNVRLYVDGANYNGPYVYFGLDNGVGTPLTNYVSGPTAQVVLNVNRVP